MKGQARADREPVGRRRPLALGELRRGLADPATRQAALVHLGDWVVATCLLYGAEARTAYLVAGAFVDGIAASWEE